jgi:hypothetical protein
MSSGIALEMPEAVGVQLYQNLDRLPQRPSVPLSSRHAPNANSPFKRSEFTPPAVGENPFPVFTTTISYPGRCGCSDETSNPPGNHLELPRRVLPRKRGWHCAMFHGV